MSISILLLIVIGCEIFVFSPAQTEVLIDPDCPFSNCDDDYLRNKVEPYIPVLVPSLARVDSRTLSDQGFVRSMYHPPRSIF